MTTIDFYLKDLWSKTLDSIANTGVINKEVFDLYFIGSKIYTIEDDVAKIVVPNYINYTFLSSNKELIQDCLSEEANHKLTVEIIREDQLQIANSINTSLYTEFKSLDPNYTFANFVVGRSNNQAQFASLTCAMNLGVLYNPLFIYGNSGLGKTHLLNAIGNQVLSVDNRKKVGLISGLDFVEGVASSIKNQQINEFKQQFYDLDLLLVDDIQFIAGKEKTHEIFFTIFNYLVNNHKQICITADKSPSEIKGLEERIITRFNQGLNVNIEAPEYETSINILKMKIKNNVGITQNIDEEVLNYIASNFSQDVRSLEGAINRLLFYSINFSKEDHISLKLAMEAFKDQIKDTGGGLDISIITRVVCDYYNLTKQQIISKTRTKNIANARHIAMYLCRKLLDAPFKDIGNEFGKRDHSTVISACERVEKLIKNDPLYLKAINEIESKLR